MNELSIRANRLERILRRYLDCSYVDFGVKANGQLDTHDWISPINFALGYKYMESNRDPLVKDRITDFLGNRFYGLCINDLLSNLEFYNFSGIDDALDEVDAIIDEFEDILNM